MSERHSAQPNPKSVSLHDLAPADVAATFCAVLVDEWVRSGIEVACIAPGSRSTPLALALAARPELRVEVFHDERSASFAALGVGLATGRPAVVLCSSGTAAAHFHAAVIEADLSGVPMIVVTADRPSELVDVAAPQTIDQTKLYGGAVRWFHAPGVASAAQAQTWRSLGSRAAAEAFGFGSRPGPVHLNLAFREPLVGQSGTLPEGRGHGAPWHSVVGGQMVSSEPLTAALLEAWATPRGVIVAGAQCGDPSIVLRLGEVLGWPVLADHRSGCAVPDRSIRHFDAMLRHPGFSSSHRPDVVVHIGEAVASKVTNQWLAKCDAVHHAIVPRAKWIDPDHLAGALVIDPSVLADVLAAASSRPRSAIRFADDWERADRSAAAAIAEALQAQHSLTDPAVARAAVGAVPSGGALVVASSMPIRDVEWFGPARHDISVFANRGANGIDGILATAIGVAAAGRPTVCLIGDVALLHDSSSLAALARRRIDLTVVVVDNDGGAIFSFLPQATALSSERYEQLFGTPHGTDIVALCRSHRLDATALNTASDLSVEPGVRFFVAKTDRAANVLVHETLNAAVVAALDTLEP